MRSNPTSELALPHRERIEDEDGEKVRALTHEQLAAFLAVVHPRHWLMFRVLAATGLRISELIALQWRHLRLDGSHPCVRVRRALVRGRDQPPEVAPRPRGRAVVGGLVSALREHRRQSEWNGDEDLVIVGGTAGRGGDPIFPAPPTPAPANGCVPSAYARTSAPT